MATTQSPAGASQARATTPSRSASRQGSDADGPVASSVGTGEQSAASSSNLAAATPSRTYAKAAGHSSNTSFYPASDAQTYRDLLIFEERLKQNAARLVKRKKKYQTFLVLLCIAIAVSAYYVFMQPAEWQPLHYLNVSNLLITSTMLLLFFASGMYAERITAANKFVPQANRSLRAYNMYLNTRTASRRGFFSLFSSSPPSPTGSRSPVYLPGEKETGAATRLVRTPSPNGGPSVARRMAIPAIPPTTNPRGELIFGSKVSQQFREGYERYRSAFERRRQEKLEERRQQGWRGWRIFGGRKSAASSVDPERGAHGEKSRTATPPMRGTGQLGSRHGHSSSASGRQSPRAHRSRLRSDRIAGDNSPGSETSSPASSRRSSPNASPRPAARARLGSVHRKSTEVLAEEVASIAEDREGSQTSRGETGSDEASQSVTMDAPKILLQEGAPQSPADSAPDPSTVASRADDRHDPSATLREPAAS